MRNVVGIGGVFFRSKDADALALWYEKHLGINKTPQDLETPPWTTEGGVTVFSPFRENTDYFPEDKQFMLNFRVRDLETLLAALRGEGIQVSHEESIDGLGSFARIHDPEGNPVELWQPQDG